MVTNEENVPRFSLRRGARFLETFRDEPPSEEGDQGWLADLSEKPDEDGGTSLGELEAGLERDPAGESDAASEQPEPVALEVPEPPPRVYPAALSDAVATLADRLAILEEALARTAAACTVARAVLGEGQSLVECSSGATDDTSRREEASVVDLPHEMGATPEPPDGPATRLP